MISSFRIVVVLEAANASPIFTGLNAAASPNAELTCRKLRRDLSFVFFIVPPLGVVLCSLVSAAVCCAAATVDAPNGPRGASTPASPFAARSCEASEGSSSPCSTRRSASGQEDPAHDQDPDNSDHGRDEPRIGTVRRPESIAHPRGAAQQGEHDGCDARRE
jgi:hypothetical protein